MKTTRTLFCAIAIATFIFIGLWQGEACAANYVAIQGVNYRTGPGTNYPRLGTLRRGQVVIVTGSYGGWYEIALEYGAKGYVYSRYLAPQNSGYYAPPAPPTPPAPTYSADKFAALAYSNSSGNYAFAYNHASRYNAEQAALGECGYNDCSVISWCKNACISIAGDGYGRVYGDWGANYNQAQNKALQGCGAGCRVLDTYCNE